MRVGENSPAIYRWVVWCGEMVSPGGTEERCVCKDSFAPDGAGDGFWSVGPSDKSLGYFQSSLRDLQGRIRWFGRHKITRPHGWLMKARKTVETRILSFCVDLHPAKAGC